MTTEEKYPNFARLTALLNQQKHPRRTLRVLVDLVGGKEGSPRSLAFEYGRTKGDRFERKEGKQCNTREHD